MALGDRIKELRKERGWSQTHLAEKVASDARGISRYEAGHITPSLDTLIRIAEAFNVSLDYLAIDNTPRRPLHTNTPDLTDHLTQAHELPPTDQTSLLNILDALLTKNRIRAVVDTTT